MDNRVFAGNGNDKVFGGVSAPGTAAANAQRDELYGGGGNDKIYAQNPGQLEIDKSATPERWDYLVGGDDDDEIFGSNTIDMIWGDHSPGMDAAVGPNPFDSDGDDILRGGGGPKDFMWGGGGDDKIYGGDGEDYIYGGEGNDKIFAGDTPAGTK